jgi:site-specific recombinase XerD
MDLLDQFASQLESEHTRRAYLHDLRQFVQFMGWAPSDSNELTEVQAGDLQDFVDQMQTANKSLATQRRRISAIRQFYAWLQHRGIIADQPAWDSVPLMDSEPSSSSGPDPFLRRAQIESILDSTNRDTMMGRRDYAMVLLILFATLRRSELARLNSGDIRPLSRYWVVDLSGDARGQGGYVPVPDNVADAVQLLVESYDTSQGPLWRSLSPQNRGERLSPDALYKAVRRAGDRAGLEGLTIETLRQSGLRLASKGGATVQELRRHARLQNPASATRYCTEDESSRLSNQVGNRISIDL